MYVKQGSDEDQYPFFNLYLSFIYLIACTNVGYIFTEFIWNLCDLYHIQNVEGRSKIQTDIYS